MTYRSVAVIGIALVRQYKRCEMIKKAMTEEECSSSKKGPSCNGGMKTSEVRTWTQLEERLPEASYQEV